MTNYLDYLPRKSFNTYGFVVLLLFVVFNAIIIGISSKSTTELQCYHKSNSKTKDISLIKTINAKCSLKYQEKFHFITVPIYVLFLLNFGIIFGLSIAYAYLVKHRVEKFDYQTGTAATTNDDNEDHPMLSSLETPNQNPRYIREFLGHFSTFLIYIVHLIIARIIVSLVFALVVFYPAQIPNSFSCPWHFETQGKGTSVLNDTHNSRYNLTTIDCTNPNGRKSRNLFAAVANWNVFLVIMPAVLELIYFAWVTFNDRRFMTEQEFCTVYLLRKRKRIRKLVNKVRASFSPYLFEAKDDFPAFNISRSILDEIYVNVVIMEGRERPDAYPKRFSRHRIYQNYLHMAKTAITLRSTANVFKPSKGRSTYPRTILVIGRPGIGKTMLARKLLHEWKINGSKFWHDKVVILLRFRTLNNEPVTLREMLGFGDGLTSTNFQTVYEFVLVNPSKSILIFDGLDELTVDEELLTDKMETISSNKKMPVFSVFKLLLYGQLLPGVTILTTSRPTAEHYFSFLFFERTVEILGFSKEQIKEYVFKFCEKEQSTSKLIWNQIERSAELQSLCYVPVNSYIVCLTLKSSIEDERADQLVESSLRTLPQTITELYKRAVKVLLFYHHPAYKGKKKPKGYLTKPFPVELQNDLMRMEEIAMDGIDKGKLIFELDTSVEGNGFVNCGMLSQLEDTERDMFCFLHLTLQEFLAALKVVDRMYNVDQFLQRHVDDPKWHLVIQFVAGLVGDKIREHQINGQNWPRVINDIVSRFTSWACSRQEMSTIPFLGTKCCHELQEIDIVKPYIRKEHIQKIALNLVNIEPIDSTALFEFFGCCEDLAQISFNHVKTKGPYSCQMMQKMLFNKRGNAVTSFSWFGGVTNENVKYLSYALKGEHNQLVYLALLNIPDITTESIKYLCNALKSKNCKLKSLVLIPDANPFHDDKIENKGIRYLCKALKDKHCKLEDLCLSRYIVTEKDFQYLNDALRNENCKFAKITICADRDDNRNLITPAYEQLYKIGMEKDVVISHIYKQDIEFYERSWGHIPGDPEAVSWRMS